MDTDPLRGPERTMAKRSRPPVKAYRNTDFLMGPDARPIRILSEFLEPLSRFRRLKVRDTIVSRPTCAPLKAG